MDLALLQTADVVGKLQQQQQIARSIRFASIGLGVVAVYLFSRGKKLGAAATGAGAGLGWIFAQKFEATAIAALTKPSPTIPHGDPSNPMVIA